MGPHRVRVVSTPVAQWLTGWGKMHARPGTSRSGHHCAYSPEASATGAPCSPTDLLIHGRSCTGAGLGQAHHEPGRQRGGEEGEGERSARGTEGGGGRRKLNKNLDCPSRRGSTTRELVSPSSFRPSLALCVFLRAVLSGRRPPTPRPNASLRRRKQDIPGYVPTPPSPCRLRAVSSSPPLPVSPPPPPPRRRSLACRRRPTAARITPIPRGRRPGRGRPTAARSTPIMRGRRTSRGRRVPWPCPTCGPAPSAGRLTARPWR